MKIDKITPNKINNSTSGIVKNKISEGVCASEDYMKNSYQIPFTSMHKIVPKMLDVDLEKNKLLKQITEILELDVTELTPEEFILNSIRKMIDNFRSIRQKKEAISSKVDAIINDNSINQQQKINLLNQYKKEYLALKKKTVKKENPPPKTDEKTDFQLMNKFKSALTDDNFNLLKVFKAHYKELENIKTLDELSKKYPKIKIPPRPEIVISKKIVDSLTRDFYEKFDDCCAIKDFEGAEELVKEVIIENLKSAKLINNMSLTYDRLMTYVGTAIVDQYKNILKNNSISSIPVNRKQKGPLINENDVNMLNVDFDNFIITVHKKQYLEGQKLNDIIYEENGYKIPVKNLGSSEYKIEKVSEKVRKIISDANRILTASRDYDRLPTEKLKSKLEHIVNSELGENEDIFNLIVKFDSCRFEQEDVSMLKRFLQEADKFEDGSVTLNDVVSTVKKEDLKPKGTEKLDKLEQEKVEQKLKSEQKKLIELKKLQNDFDDAINALYINGFNSSAIICAKYRPEASNIDSIENANFIIKLVKENIADAKPINKFKLDESVSRWNTFKYYENKNANSKVFNKAKLIATNEDGSINIDKAGQYLQNYEKVEGYPDTLDFVTEPEVLTKIMDKVGDDIEKAVTYLTKYDDYLVLSKNDKAKISVLLEKFDLKDSMDKILLKHIVENDYMNSDTVIQTRVHEKSTETFETVFDANAKKQIYDYFKFPNCLEYFEDFEKALTTTTASSGASGIKRMNNNKTLAHKIEVKINGKTPRLFSSQNNYVFDIFSFDGLH